MHHIYMRYPGGRAKRLTLRYDHVQAYRQLIWSADCSSVYSPTATHVWLQAGKTTLCVAAGQRVTL